MTDSQTTHADGCHTWGPEHYACALAKIELLEAALKRQAAAAISGMDAAKRISSEQLRQAKRLRDESSPDALESERAANALLTEEVERLTADKRRMDWLADPSNPCGVQLPREIVERNVHSLRAAIDEAMEQQ